MFTPKIEPEWLKSYGYLKIDEKAGRAAIQINNDFVNYYLWFIQRAFKIVPSTGKMGGHISLVLPKFHKNVDFSSLRRYEGSKIEFEYSPDIFVGGQSKGFMNFWIKVKSEKIERIKTLAGVMDRGESFQLHITLGNTKNLLHVPSWQPKMIEIRKSA